MVISIPNSKLLKALFDLFGDDIRLVGGAVRDILLGKNPTDYDLATPFKPTEVMSRLHKAVILNKPYGESFGVIQARIGTETAEIATLRQDVLCDGRHAVVSYTTDWKEDALRRDFTINAIYATATGDIFDPVGGVDDIKNGVVRFIGDADKRIEEDYLRVLRYYRFYGLFGKNELLDLSKYRPMMELLSVERIRDEFAKILSLPDLHKVIRPVIALLFDPVSEENILKVCQLPADLPLVRFCALFGEDAVRLSKKLLFSSTSIKHITWLLKAKPLKSLEQMIFRHGFSDTRDLISLKDNTRIPDLNKLIDYIPPVCPITAKELMDQGMKEGPALGKKLKELSGVWERKTFK